MIMKLQDIYQEELSSFDRLAYDRGYDDNTYKCRLDDLFIEGKTFKSVEIVEDNQQSALNDWQANVIFKYKDNFYYCEYSEGSHGSGSNLDQYSLKQVFPKTKEVTYYE